MVNIDNIFVKKDAVSDILDAGCYDEILVAINHLNRIIKTYGASRDESYVLYAYKTRRNDFPTNDNIVLNKTNLHRIPCDIDKYKRAYIEIVTYSEEYEIDLFVDFLNESEKNIVNIAFFGNNDKYIIDNYCLRLSDIIDKLK